MTSPDSIAGKRLLFRYTKYCTTNDDFEQCVKDITSLTNLSPDTIQEARNEFVRKSRQPARQRPVINAASLKFWLFDIAVLIAIGLGLTSLWDHGEFVAVEPVREQTPADLNSSRASKAASECASDECVCPPITPLAQSTASCTPISTQVFKVTDTVDVIDPNLDYTFAIPWRITNIHSNQDGTLRFNLTRSVAGNQIFMVMDNANSESITRIKPFTPNEEALCEFDMQIHPCVILGLVDPRIPGGGVYRVSFRPHDGRVQEAYRPAWNIWRIDSKHDAVTTAFPHPLAIH